MIMKKGFVQASFLIAVLFATLSSCKKYPENKLWFKRPSDALIGHWNLEKITVNGVDSKKFITINATSSFGPPTFYGAQKNLFRDNQTWKIEKLSKSQFWISVTNSNSGYLLKFKN